jgi:hypothetical protein
MEKTSNREEVTLINYPSAFTPLVRGCAVERTVERTEEIAVEIAAKSFWTMGLGQSEVKRFFNQFEIGQDSAAIC